MLGEILLEKKLIAPSVLEACLNEQKSKGLPLGKLLIQKRLISEEHLLEALARQMGVHPIHLDKTTIDPSAVKAVSSIVEKSTVTSCPTGLERYTENTKSFSWGTPAFFFPLDRLPSVPLASPMEIETSLSLIVPVPAGVRMIALVGLLSRTEKVSVPSTLLSSEIATAIVWLPAEAKLSVPLSAT